MSNYLPSIGEFCSLSPFNEDQAVELEAKRPGHLMALCVAASGFVDARGAKRGDVPFTAPYPDPVRKWVANLVTPEAFESLGTRPSDELQERIDKKYDETMALLKEFADQQASLLLLPIQKNSKVLQENAPVTLSYSEQSPYTSRHKQFDAVRSNRRYG